jgi:hypothetical protein
MRTSHSRTRPSSMCLPIQAPPVRRDEPGFRPARASTQHGVGASQSACSNLTGMARQMCYASQYGVHF